MQRSILLIAVLCGVVTAARADDAGDYADLKRCFRAANALDDAKAGTALAVKLYETGAKLGKNHDQVVRETLTIDMFKIYKDDPDALASDKAFCEGKGLL